MVRQLLAILIISSHCTKTKNRWQIESSNQYTAENSYDIVDNRRSLERCAEDDAIDVYIITETYADAYLRVFEEEEIWHVAKSDADFMLDPNLYLIGCLFEKNQIVRVIKVDVIKVTIQWFINKTEYVFDAKI